MSIFTKVRQLFLPSLIFVSSHLFAQLSFVFPTKDTTWVVPACVSTVTVQVWGGSGAGFGATGNAGGGGGGGGGYSSAVLTVTPGSTYSISVGTPGPGSTGSGGDGGDSWFQSTATVLAKGGKGSTGATGGAGGVVGVGTVKFAGGKGGNYSGNGGGGGGATASSAGTGAAGANGSGDNGGAGGAGLNGSSGGGAGGNNNGAGIDNVYCVACGGGGGVGTAGGTAGNGSFGIVRITLPPPLVAMVNAPQIICPNNSPSTLTASATGGSGGAYSFVWQSSTTDSISGFSTIAGQTASTYSPGSINVTTWYRSIVNAAGCAILDTADAVKVLVTNLTGSVSFPQIICTGSTATTLTVTANPASAAPTYQWQSSTSSSSSGFSPIAGATSVTYAPGAISVPTWYSTIISASSCVTYTTSVIAITPSNAPATCNAGGPSTIYSTNVLPLVKSSVGGSVTTGAWSIASSTPAATHMLSSTAQTNTPSSVTFTPQNNYTGTVVLALTTNSNGCGTSVCNRTINVIAATITTVTFSLTGNSTWTVPSCVNTVTVQTWGAGGGGGSGGSTLQDDGSGAGAGAFSSSVISVKQGTVYNLHVGAGGIGAVHTAAGKKGDNGENTWFGNLNTVFAQGGIGGLGVGQPGYGNPSLGGSATAGFGNLVKWSGGKGASGCLWPGGGGGGSASPTSNGNDAPPASNNNCNSSSNSSTPGAAAIPGGGSGGNGGESQGPGITGTCTTLLATPGGFPGGGGGGGTNACDQPGQPGGNGQVKILYGPALPVFITANSATICNGQSVILKGYTDFPISFKWSTGATVDSIIVSPTVNTTYTVTDLGGCAAPVTVSVTVNSAFVAGVTSTTICSGQPGTLTATGATSYSWSTGATTNAITDSPASTKTYSVTATKNGCSIPLTGTISVNSSSSLTVNSASICAGQTATLSASGATSYSWAPATSLSSTSGATVTSTATVTITYTVTGTTSNCTSSGTSTVNVSSVPISNAGADISICSGVVGNIGAPTTAGNTYLWSPATDLSSNLISDPTVTTTNNTAGPIVTSYTVTSSSPGCSSTDVVKVTVNPQDDASFSYTSAAYCAPSNDTPIKTKPGTGTFSINPAANLSIISGSGFIDITAATNVAHYIVTLTTADACPNTYTVGIDVVANPDATFSYAAPAYCVNATPNPTITQPFGSTAGTFSASPAGLVFISTATGEIDLAASAPNTYTVTNSIPAGGGCLATSKVTTITVNSIPIVTTSSTTVCAGAMGILNASGAAGYTWTGGSGGFPGGATLSDSPANTTPYVVTGTTSGCSATATGIINITPNPTVTVTNSNDCAGIPQTITASGAASYTWTGGGVPSGAGNQDLTDSPVVPSTSYNVTGTTNGCTGSASGTIVVDPSPTVTVTNSAACLGFPATLTATPANNASLVWSSGETTTFITKTPVALGANTYTVTVTGTNPLCIDTAIATIFVYPNPVVTVTSSPVVCLGTTSTLTASGPATAYSWSPGGSTLNPLTVVGAVGSVVYTVTGTVTATGCTGTQTGTVTVNPVPNVTVNNATICAGKTATLSASGATTYSWSPNIGATASVSATPGTTTPYTVTGTSLGCSNTAVSNVTVNALPIVTVNSASICAGSIATLTASGAATYSWMPGGSVASSINVNPNVNTPYTVTGTSLANCAGSAIGTVTAYPVPVASFADPLKMKLSEANISFMDNSSNANSWAWDFGDATTSILQNPQHQYADTGIYVICLKVVSNGCIDSICHNLTIVPDVLIFIPNGFSPDGDGINEQFGFKGSGIGSDIQFSIFDRWGELIFFTTHVNEMWKGDKNGVPCPQDVYVYSIVIKDSNGKDKRILGQVTLIR